MVFKIEYKLISEYNEEESIIEHIFKNRGFKTKEEIYEYTHTTKDDLIDPLKLTSNFETEASIVLLPRIAELILASPTPKANFKLSIAASSPVAA